MQYAAVSMAITSFFLFFALLYPVGRRIDDRRRRLNQVTQQEKLFLNEELKQPFAQRFLRPF
jgi:hypothetical protein